ncbi:YtxH domain-containing protein [Hymenobacter cellulosivorans]|uniref:YtxH domain-containing protein n=1 Tax=Hymenobacter cellulosivorans TaxID=2932249 RepID=A0ABY4FFI0_9BACT|nr:YtxH domain-containing protein [Hymenobacter cellulosivorans]UOQ55273.1 YtxH domain-containing protein [Hymenobacter cellulosivorans]
MKDNNGKVILSLLAGATAGVVAGLLLAPETGEETRTGLKKSASKWTDDLGKLLKDTLANIQLAKPADAATDATQESRSAADDVLSSMSQDTGTGASSHATTAANTPGATEETINPEASGTSEYGKSL